MSHEGNPNYYSTLGGPTGVDCSPGSCPSNYPWTVKSEYDYMAKKTEVEIDDEADILAAPGVVKKQSEVWVYNDEVFATYEKAASASLTDRIGIPLTKSYYKRAGYSATQIKQMSATNKANKNTVVYLDDVIALLPQLIKEVSA